MNQQFVRQKRSWNGPKKWWKWLWSRNLIWFIVLDLLFSILGLFLGHLSFKCTKLCNPYFDFLLQSMGSMESMGCKDAKKTFFVKTAMYKVNFFFFFCSGSVGKKFSFHFGKRKLCFKSIYHLFFFPGQCCCSQKNW